LPSIAARLLHGLELHHAAVFDLGHPALVEQDVCVAEHLAEREIGLGDGDVAPQDAMAGC